jgi:hypothetical protein
MISQVFLYFNDSKWLANGARIPLANIQKQKDAKRVPTLVEYYN